MLDAIGNVLGFILSFIVNIVGDYGWSIVVFTILVRLCLLPLMVKQLKSTKAMQDIQPKMLEIQEKYKNKPEKQQEELMKLYKDAKINPMAGCLPMLIQLPILMGLFALLRDPVAHGVFASKAAYLAADHGFLWIASVSQTHNLSLGILSGVSAYFMQKSMTVADESQAKMMQSMTIMMTAMSFFWGYTYEAGLALYWTMSNIFSIAQYYLVTSPLKAKMANSKEEVVKDEKSNRSSKKEQPNKNKKSGNKK
ncbi:MAG: YidC/Oxa1 family membrane protein insertase [Intestinibacter sp.]